ncbi:MAG: methyl-accepting chemotaxis protein [gamma proteobacterium endosymbiont of Lamellibrachia anaximandri]|nr:methyl-accepting chemotaxis protein [gamma proteobacterium endosymbiont of Lamellibrachia anaximandri]MBL3534766.1 methyl-accepting chemotaxis protein [gamma proteobacterium endosymbiont of Lamellibrachia anaximandri]
MLEIYDYALDRQVDNERQMLIMQSDFKKQVQEWKNVLLRGSEKKNFDKYWGKFEAREASIKAEGDRLMPRLENEAAKKLLRSFLSSHVQMGAAYRTGLEQFKQAGFDPKAGDKAVKGIDRAPTKKLAEAAEHISQRLYQSTSHLPEKSYYAMVISLLTVLAALITFTGITVWMVRRVIINPTKDISVSLKRFANGDFSKIDIEHHGGELGEVAESAIQVKEHLGGIIREVRGSAVELTQAAGRLSVATHSTQNDLGRQQGDIQQVATAMDQMSDVVSQVSSNAQAAVEAARSADAASIDGRKIVETGIIEVRELAQDVEGAADVVKSLEGDVANISSVLDVIKSIAEQTNLLALNAAIEAARAGEQGRGFAVVADEVRTLAGRTQESTSEIQQMIERLEMGSGRAVKVMAESRQRVEASVEHASKAGESLRQITTAVAAIAQMNEQIVASSTEQSSVTEEIHRSITSINDLARHTGESAQTVSDSGEGVAALAANMETLVGRFKV